jgi:hypothetical protein
VTTLDLSLKINQHLEAARRRARAGGAHAATAAGDRFAPESELVTGSGLATGLEK